MEGWKIIDCWGNAYIAGWGYMGVMVGERCGTLAEAVGAS